jgi:hypothetical protein
VTAQVLGLDYRPHCPAAGGGQRVARPPRVASAWEPLIRVTFLDAVTGICRPRWAREPLSRAQRRPAVTPVRVNRARWARKTLPGAGREPGETRQPLVRVTAFVNPITGVGRPRGPGQALAWASREPGREALVGVDRVTRKTLVGVQALIDPIAGVYRPAWVRWPARWDPCLYGNVNNASWQLFTFRWVAPCIACDLTALSVVTQLPYG